MSTNNIAAGRIVNKDSNPLMVEEDGAKSQLPVTNDVGVFLVSTDSSGKPVLSIIPAWVNIVHNDGVIMGAKTSQIINQCNW